FICRRRGIRRRKCYGGSEST
ncbi:unnamed protein product, partial [Linum tenue]